ncbi:hypothetical protein JW968_05575 [Candidatus Woesearchaeota archaeon]|nr:hypothetical protein [Candidatus Woesearchaeota archaeon]
MILNIVRNRIGRIPEEIESLMNQKMHITPRDGDMILAFKTDNTLELAKKLGNQKLMEMQEKNCSKYKQVIIGFKLKEIKEKNREYAVYY